MIVDGRIVAGPPADGVDHSIAYSVRGEYLFHTVFLVIASAILLLSFLMRAEGEYAVYLPGFTNPLPSGCSSRVMLGMDCPGCGLTRAFISISHGQFARAIHFNPAGILVYLFVLAQIPWRLYQFSRLIRGRMCFFSPWLFVAPAVVILTLITQWIFRVVLA